MNKVRLDGSKGLRRRLGMNRCFGCETGGGWRIGLAHRYMGEQDVVEGEFNKCKKDKWYTTTVLYSIF